MFTRCSDVQRWGGFEIEALQKSCAVASPSALSDSSKLPNPKRSLGRYGWDFSVTTMSAKPKSRWAQDDENDALADAQRKREKEEKKRLKAEKQRKLEEAEKARAVSAANPGQREPGNSTNGYSERPTKRRRLSEERDGDVSADQNRSRLLQFPSSNWGPCRHVDNFEKLNHIEEGSYGWVSRAKESATGEIVALKKLKMENPTEGFPITGLREIQTLLEARHANIVYLREIVIGNSRNE